MSNKQNTIVAAIRDNYLEENKQVSKVTKLLQLDKKAKLPAEIFAYSFGTAGALVLGTGMCFAMDILAKGWVLSMPVGILVGLVGIAMVSVNYFIYRKMLRKGKEKYRNQVLTLSEEILSE